MRIDVVSLFPEFVAQCAGFGVVGRAQERGLLSLHGWNPRDYADRQLPPRRRPPVRRRPRHGDADRSAARRLAAARAADPAPAKVDLPQPAGRAPDPGQGARAGRAASALILLCGRYEGIDERLIAAEVDEELSIGDYVLSGGELAAAVVVDAVARLQEGALNDAESAAQDSFEDGLLDCPHYTRPVEHALGTVPAVLMSGNHAADRPLAPAAGAGPDLAAPAGPARRRPRCPRPTAQLLDAFRAGLGLDAAAKRVSP